jgi:hypothetical protein
MAQQTAVEFLLTELDIAKLIEREKLTMAAEVVRQAKAMEKEQIVIAHGTKSNGRLKNDGQFIISEITGEQYYKETYE